MLVDSAVFYKSRSGEEESQENPVSNLLRDFFKRLQVQINENENKFFWTRFFKNFSNHFWNGGVLVYVTQGLAELPRNCVLDSESVNYFRKLLSLTVSAHDVVFRSAIQLFVTKAFFNFVDPSEIRIDSILIILGCLRSPDTLHHGNLLWRFLLDWLKWRGLAWQNECLHPELDIVISNWLQSTTDLSDFKEDLTDIPECLAIVRLLLLSSDVEKETNTNDGEMNKSSFFSHFSPVLDVLLSANSRAYMSEVRVHQAYLFLLALFKESKFHVGQISDDVVKLASEVVGEILVFTSRKMMNVVQMLDFKPVPMYLILMTSLSEKAGFHCLFKSSAVEALLEKYIALLLTGTTKVFSVSSCVGLEVIRVICFLASKESDLFDSSFQTEIAMIKKFCTCWTFQSELSPLQDDDNISDNRSVFHHIRANFLFNQWLILSFYLNQTPDILFDLMVEYIAFAEQTLDTGSPEALVQCLQVLAVVLPKMSDDLATTVLTLAWKRVIDLMRKNSFWSVYSAFLDMAFQKELIHHTSSDSTTTQFLCKCFEDIIMKSDEKSGMLKIIISKLCCRINEDSVFIDHMIQLVPCFAKALTFGPIHDKSKRFHLEVLEHLQSLKDFFSEEDLTVMVREDAIVRMNLLSLISRLDQSRSSHNDFRLSLSKQLMTNHRKLLNNKQNRSYANCMTHRIKHRILISLMLLETFLLDNRKSYIEFLMELLEKETQPSIRFLSEWMFLRLVRIEPELTNFICCNIEQGAEKRPAFMSSLFIIVSHVVDVLPTANNKTEFISKALLIVLPWCMAPNFHVRVFAQATLLRLWSTVKEIGLEQLQSTYGLIENIELFITSNRDSFWAPTQLLSNYYYFNFHPMDDYSMESLVHTVPRLTNMTDEEWLNVDLFPSVDVTWNQPNSHSLPLYNKGKTLKKCTSGVWKTKPLAGGCLDDVTIACSSSVNVQKKLVPWQSLVLSINTAEHQMLDDGLILVTSLINRIPNLGGLCRTCEIFGVSKFIIGSMRYVEDKAFETVSVTSQKWVSIEEVQPNQLLTYLLKMKKEGYMLLGAEQTSKSHCLTKFNFPRKSLLVLGNERCGIPVEMLQVLDACIEIPQSGKIRSLNVHVTGAILIWEYYKQWILPNDNNVGVALNGSGDI